ncbi:sperm-associated antigen 1 [Selaginella moellendorffii]|uniref:sperm-associated antigen 1 n=1 Tax=Selaginella moellendorffii TaxID=88036 RepID=UPI000D1C6A3B|nr:sperm-associated antigen 1 [Selaginella moellendorffii]|eukprot:XP_024525713.1 sperm-associated antigen 1 [Selaginella moellendorffii]
MNSPQNAKTQVIFYHWQCWVDVVHFLQEDDCKTEEKIPHPKKTKERNAIVSKSQTEREWHANREREKGNELFKAREYIASLDAYSLSLELFSNSATTFANRAAVQVKLNRWDDAVADCSKALELDPNHVKALLRRGVAYLEIGRPEAALRDLTAAFDLDSSCKEASTLKEKAERAVRKKQKDDDKLADSCKRISIEEVGGEDESRSSSALLEMESRTPALRTRVTKTQKFPQREIFTKEIVPEGELKVLSERKLSPALEENSSYIPMRAGPMVIEEIVETKCEPEESSTACRPENTNDAREEANKQRTIGNEHFKSQDYCAAIKCYNRSLSLDPGVAATFANRALCYLKMRDWNTAISDCSEAITIDCGYAKAYYRRALAFEGLGDLRGALKDLQAALKLQPDDSEIGEKLRTIKRKLRVSFVKESSQEEAGSDKNLEETSGRSPSMHEIKTQIGEGACIPVSQPQERPIAPERNVRQARATTVPEKPRTAIEFQRSCERLQGQSQLLREFISRIHIDEYPGIFKENLSVEVLRTILKSLQAAFMPHDPAGTMAVLGGLVKVKRFGLILKLLAPCEKNTFLSIFDWLRDSCGAPLDRAQELKAQFY